MQKKIDYIPVEKGKTPVWYQEEYLKHIIAHNTENSKYVRSLPKNIEVASCVSEQHHQIMKERQEKELQKNRKRKVYSFLMSLSLAVIPITTGFISYNIAKNSQGRSEENIESEFNAAMVEYTTLAVRILDKYTYNLGDNYINTPSGTHLEKVFGYDHNGIGKTITLYSDLNYNQEEEYTTDILLLEIYKNIPIDKEGNMKHILDHINDTYDFGATSMEEYYSYLGYQSLEEFKESMEAKATYLFEQKNKRGML